MNLNVYTHTYGEGIERFCDICFFRSTLVFVPAKSADEDPVRDPASMRNRDRAAVDDEREKAACV